VALLDEPLRERDHLRDVFCAFWLHVGAQHAERVHVHVELADEFFGDLLRTDAHFIGALDDLVVHVCKIAHKGHVIALEAQVAHQHVKNHRAARMADVAEVVGSDAANIHGHGVAALGDEFLLGAAKGVVQAH